jgi:hypothetical protein
MCIKNGWLTERYKNEISGVMGCYDRVIIRGTPGNLGYADGMTAFFNTQNFKIFDFHKVFTPITNGIKENIEKKATENGIEIEYVRKVGAFRKDDKIAEILSKRGKEIGLVHIFSQLEVLDTFDPWCDKETKRCYFKPASTKRLVYYVYIIDKLLGLCYIKIPTVAPFTLGFYFNGHGLLETKLNKENISFIKQENAFLSVCDFEKAQNLSDEIDVKKIHTVLDGCAKRYCPLPEGWNINYQWTLSEVEYSYDIIFKNAEVLKPIYDNIITTAMHTITPENIANYLGKRFSLQFGGEAGSRYNKRILGTRIKHQLGDTSVKIYDKFGSVLRIEVTSRNVSEMRVFRDVQKRDGTIEAKMAPVKKSIYSLFDLTKLFMRACLRYLEAISAFDDPIDGLKKLDQAVENVTDNNRIYKGFNFFCKEDKLILLAVANPKFNIDGMRNKHLRELLVGKSTAQISRLLKRLRVHLLIEKVRGTLKYRLTPLGKQVITAGLGFINMSLVPELSQV